MAHYCRYCAYCFGGDCYYCSHKDKVLNRINVQTQCRDFVLSALGDVDTGKMYRPRKKAIQQENDCEQMKLL